MNYARILTMRLAAISVSVASIVSPAITAVSRAAAVTPDAQACINTAIFKLNGVPRSAISATAGTVAADGTRQINWSTRDGGEGVCWVDASNKVVQFKVEVDPSLHPSASNANGAFAVAGKSVMVSTSGGSLNIRSSPGGDIVGSAPDGSTLVLTGQSNSEWVEIVGGGWVSRYLLTEAATPSSPTAATPVASANPATNQTTDLQHKQAIVATDGGGLNVRSSPDGDITASLTDGSTVTLTGQKNGNWVEIEGGGWVSADYLKYQ
jgi:hypothetical protein